MTLETIAERPRSHPYRECPQRQGIRSSDDLKPQVPGGRRLWRQMVVGFICAAFLGLIMLLLGSIFIRDAVEGNTSISIMLCIMGMVCGLIILVGTAILGRLFISRKWRVQEDENGTHHRPPEVCFHTCSIIYTPSLDQLNVPPFADPPPSYEMVIFSQRGRAGSDDNVAGCVELNDAPGTIVQPIIMSPPKYSIAAAPLPEYEETI